MLCVAWQIMMGDFQELPLENLSTLSQEVYLPLICNPENQEGWPEVITKEVTDNFHKFIANSTHTVGCSSPVSQERDSTGR